MQAQAVSWQSPIRWVASKINAKLTHYKNSVLKIWPELC